MRAVIQRVKEAQVSVDQQVIGSCQHGLLILLGIGSHDTDEVVQRFWHKIRNLRIFEDDQGKTNLSLANVEGELLVVSQFTLYANCRKGNRPSFIDAAQPELANMLYEHFCEAAEQDGFTVGRGSFGANMSVSLINDGPFTIWLDSAELGM